MIYMINSFEFHEIKVSFIQKTNLKPKSRKLEKTMPLISNYFRQIKLLVAVCMEIIFHKGEVILI